MDDKSYKDYVEEIDLQRYWLILKRRWLPATLTCVACAGAAVAYSISSKSEIYQASGKIFFQVERSSSLTGVDEGISDIRRTVGRSDPLQNQANIIQSRSVLEDVIEKLELRDSDGNLRDVGVISQGLTVRPQGGSDILRVEHQSPDPEFTASVVNQIMASYIERNIAINRSEATAARKFVEAQLPDAEAEMDQAASNLREFQERNQIVSSEVAAGSAVGQLASLDEQVNAGRIQLAELTTRVSELQSLLGLPLETAKQLDALSNDPGIQGASQQLLEVQTLLASQRSRYTESHPTIANLQRQEAALAALLEDRIGRLLGQEEFRLQEDGITVSDLQVSSIDRQLTSQLVDAEIQRLSLASRLDGLLSTRQEEAEKANLFPSLIERERELQQQLQIAKGNYETLLRRLQEAELAENQVVGTAEILELAQAPAFPLPVSNSKLLLAGVGAGVFLGISVAIFLDLIDKSIKTVKDAEALLGYVLLGLIPSFESDSGDSTSSLQILEEGEISPRIIALGQSKPMVAAAYQMLQANLKFISSDMVSRAITITSSVPQEGKSEVCANLAATMAQTGKRVLLVDADMRSPSQHHFWNVINSIGLSHILVGEGTLEQGLHQVSKNLTLLTAGVVPPNPLALVDSERMGQLVQTLLTDYDYVLFDTPPLLGAADAGMLGKASDGVLLVARPRWVDSASALSAKSLLERSGAKVLGLVANGVDIYNEHDDYVSQIKAGAYPYHQKSGNVSSEAKKKDRAILPSFFTEKYSATGDDDELFKL